jgi:AbrB family looped-hinge helix DNA binding protein
MSAARRLTTRVSTKGQVVLPATIRSQPGFQPGSELEVEIEDGRVTLKPAALFEPTTLEDFVGIVSYHGPPITIEQMDQAIDDEIAARHARGRY